MKLKSLEDTQNFAKNICKIIGSGDIIFLYGEIGVGKTTFVRCLINYIEKNKGIKNSEILSPTFNIVFDYSAKDIKIAHYDLYRLKSYKDILQLGIFETSKDHIKIVEWPELIKPKPKDRIDIFLTYSKLMNYREVKISGFGKWKDYKFNEI